MGGEFRFHVGYVSDLDDDPAYVVQLPHQCDAWQIAWHADKAAAITQLEKFIAEAQVALTRLRELSP